MFIITNDDCITEPSIFSPLFYYNCFPCLSQISILSLKESSTRSDDGSELNQAEVDDLKEQEALSSTTDNENGFVSDEGVFEDNSEDIISKEKEQVFSQDTINNGYHFYDGNCATGDENVPDNANQEEQPETKDHESIADIDNQQEVVHETKENETSEVRDPIDQSINTHYDNSQPVEIQNDDTNNTQEEENEYEEQRVMCNGDRENDIHTDYQTKQSETIDQEGYVEVNELNNPVNENERITKRIPVSSGILNCSSYMNS